MELARLGADIAINYFGHPEDAEEVCGQCKQVGVKAIAIQSDVGTQQGAESLVADAIKRLGGLEIAVSNAAYSDRQLMLDADLAGFHRTIDVTMWGAFYLVRASAKQMAAGGNGGNIVVVSSPHAVMAIPGARGTKGCSRQK